MKEYGEFKSTFYGYWKMDRKELHKNPPRIQRVAMEHHHIIKDRLQMSHFCSYVKLPDAILWKGGGARRKMTLFFSRYFVEAERVIDNIGCLIYRTWILESVS
jgi:hypothetical protein